MVAGSRIWRCPVVAWSLSHEERAQLYQLLLDAYTSKNDLERLFYFKLSRSLGSIAGEADNHDDLVFKVIHNAEQHNWLSELVRAAVEHRSDKTQLAEWAELHMPARPTTANGNRFPRLAFDLREVREIVEAGAAGPAKLAFQSVVIHNDAVHLSLRDQDTSRNYLVRVHGPVLSTESSAGRFAEEVRRAGQAAVHSRIAGLLGAGLTADGHPYLVQDIGHADLLRPSPLRVSKVIDVGAKLADALTVAHNHGATYGPIDPSHILLAADGEPLLTFPALPMFASAQAPPATPHRDVRGLCETLLALLAVQPEEGAGATGNARVAAPGAVSAAQIQMERKLREICAEAAEGRLIAAVVRDRLETVKRDSAAANHASHVLARVPGNTADPAAESEVVFVEGDLFEQEADLVVGFSDTFDTATDGSLVISPSSLQGQLVERIYQGDVEALDADLERALASVHAESLESRSAKQHGKLVRYPVGTVAVLERDRRRVFAVAFSRMDNSLTAQSTEANLLLSLANLWEEIRRRETDRTVAMPVLGAGLSRLELERDTLVKMTLTSLREHARRAPVCRELRIVIHPSDTTGFVLPVG
ncbi:macro domain-containing protein [Streptomyces aureus]|uniref:macro domain-containing protein n=1 Tax=Streptomyces aureus TaxID=193461 RepID=UPI00068A0E0F|nr:macro domain-containing protein [Streptomyces aureus]